MKSTPDPTERHGPEADAPSRGKVIAWVVGIWLGAHIVLVAGHVLLVTLYSLVVAPGLEHAANQAFAERTGPWFSIVAGGPVFWLVGRILRRRARPHGRGAGLAAWGLYTATDAAILLASVGVPPALLAGQWVVSQAVKLAAVRLATTAATTPPLSLTSSSQAGM